MKIKNLATIVAVSALAVAGIATAANATGYEESLNVSPTFPTCEIDSLSVSGAYTGTNNPTAVLFLMDGTTVDTDTDLTTIELKARPLDYGQSTGYNLAVTGEDGTVLLQTFYTATRPTKEVCGVTPTPPPALTGDQTVLFAPLCKAFELTNRYPDDSVDFYYGYFEDAVEDGFGRLEPGETTRIQTTRTEIDYVAYTFGDGRTAGLGENLVVDQVCGVTSPPVVEPPVVAPPVIDPPVGTPPVVTPAPAAPAVTAIRTSVPAGSTGVGE